MKIMISLRMIKGNDPCEEGWVKILDAKGHLKMDGLFPLSDVFNSNSLEDVLWSLQCLPEHNNLWRKYAVWCAKQVEHLMSDDRSKNALTVAWEHSEGNATDGDLHAAWAAAWAAARAAAWDAARDAARAAARDAAWDAARAAAWAAARAAARDAAWDAARDAARAAARAAARDAQRQKLIEVLNTGVCTL